jgi:hypothetical protein
MWLGERIEHCHIPTCLLYCIRQREANASGSTGYDDGFVLKGKGGED